MNSPIQVLLFYKLKLIPKIHSLKLTRQNALRHVKLHGCTKCKINVISNNNIYCMDCIYKISFINLWKWNLRSQI